MIGRRGFITGLVSLVAAPAIVRVGSIMPVRVMTPALTVENIIRAKRLMRLAPSPEFRLIPSAWMEELRR